MIYPNTDYLNTYDLILKFVKYEGIRSLSDFTKSQRNRILTTLQKEADQDMLSAMMHDHPFSRELCLSLTNLASLSKDELKLTQNQINKIEWLNVQSILDDILDQAQCMDYRESGGISDYEDARRLDASIRYQEAVNDMSSRSA